MSKTCIIYARISVATEESVSITRQLEAGRAYAAARGWTVVGEYIDEGVSATHNKPEDRVGWNALLASPAAYDVVIVWKVDRLARRVLDFLHADEALQSRGAGLVCVEDPVDMTTAQGRAFAQVLAVFGELEAATIRARVKAARNHMIRNGRYVGGTLPYGYTKTRNPDGAGWIVAQDPEQIKWVRAMVDRTLAGKTLYSTMQWLTDNDVPTASWQVPFVWREWAYSTVDKLIRHPLLAGMVPHNPGNGTRTRGTGVLRDEDGLPVVDESLAVMTVSEWRRMQAKLAEPNSHRQPRAMRRPRSGVLSGLMWCGDPRHDEPLRMWRGTTGSATGPRPAYYCRVCHQTLSNAEDVIVRHVLDRVGGLPHLTVVEEVLEGGTVQEREAELRLADLSREQASPDLTDERDDEINAERKRLRAVIAEARSRPSQVRVRFEENPGTFAEDWERAEDDDERRAIMGDALTRIVVHRGGQGAWTDAAKLARLTFEWRPAGQVETPTDAELAAWAEEDAAAR